MYLSCGYCGKIEGSTEEALYNHVQSEEHKKKELECLQDKVVRLENELAELRGRHYANSR